MTHECPACGGRLRISRCGSTFCHRLSLRSRQEVHLNLLSAMTQDQNKRPEIRKQRSGPGQSNVNHLERGNS